MDRQKNRNLIRTIDVDAEFCQVCNRGVGMIIRLDDETRNRVAPFMCSICMGRFPEEFWESDDKGVYFDLTKHTP